MENAYNTILIATDGSKEATDAFKKAVTMTLLHGEDTKLVITHVIDTPSLQSMGTFDDTFLEKLTKEATEDLEKLKKEAVAAGVKDVQIHVEYGSPRQLIAYQIPKKYNADLLILGATGLNQFEKLLIGSVTSFVVRNAKIDVLITK
ncbi:MULTISPECIES: universal stress protein [Oenococcus]|uniref:Universal stress family protein n=1 Tax=Oenococcus kitaharae DSM 17330 TaxID=1045004 RepID=G9WHJ9_9LACO|nr:universal stress protein [Oenococcus kitaharae]EHN58338.1 Universal stress family protein [Oenococcus kitaharae DSM 17330]OEY81492.1 universal stress protein UspA [Oenococcus kitaharae]OEY82979.1 universal stress protein UspA [Oenococcus kitaharae]OEY84476.1 universal stress protein UspA [Oenococcus kitaharae]